jgi:hypothetical protein
MGEFFTHSDAEFHKPFHKNNLRRTSQNIFRTGTEPALSHLIKRHDNEMDSKTGECDHGQQVALQINRWIIGSQN